MTDRDMNTLQAADACVLNGTRSDPIQYPMVMRSDKVDVYHGVEVPDPYQYLEDSSRDNTHLFVYDQNELFESYMDRSPNRALIQKKLTEVWNYPKINVPMKKGARYFFWENSGLQNHAILYVKEALSGKPRLLLDPNLMQMDGSFSIANIGISFDGDYVGYAVSESGSDWTTIRVRDVSCGHDLDDTIRYTKLTAIRWTSDNKGFFYQRFPPPLSGYGRTDGTETSMNTNEKVYYHYLGTPQESDVPVVEFPDNPSWTIGIEMSDEGDFLFVYASDVIGERNLYYASLKDELVKGFTGNLKLHALTEKPGTHWYVANDGTTAYFVTDVDAPNSRLVGFNMTAPQQKNWRTIIPEHINKTIYWAVAVNQDKLAICYMEEVQSKIQIRNLKSGAFIKEVPVEVGTASGYYGRRIDKELFILMESYINPGTVYKVDFENEKISMKLYKEAVMKSYPIDLTKIQMSQFGYSTDDGTNIPVFVIHKKGLPLDSNRPCILTAYGGFGTSTLPSFSPAFLFFAKHFNGVVAIANIRGGGEFGQRWWNEGRLLNKQNGFNDFIAGARFLVHNQYTRPGMLTIQGASNGGLLIGAVVNQRPDLFGAAIPQVGVMDMLRFQKFTIGHLWCGEYGCSEDETYFEYLKSYSPLHNINVPKNDSVQYPAILVTTADHDDRVVPLHSYKYTAELQHTIGSSPRQTNPLLIRIDTKSGHGYGKPTSKKIAERTDIFAFLELALGYKYNP